MAAPGTTITRADNQPPRSTDTDTGKYFLAGLSDRGPSDRATESHSLQEWVNLHGTRQTYNTVEYDSVDAYFREGGARLIYGRTVGPAAAKAKRNLLDGSAGVALVVEAIGPGAYGNTITVQVIQDTGSTYHLVLVDSGYPTGSYTETSPVFSTTAEAVAWSQSSLLVRITQGASTLIPAVLAASVLGNTTSGADDRASITGTQKGNALALFTKDYGPGQVSYAGATDTATHALVEAHAEDTGRIALLSAPDTATVSTITSVASTDRAATGAHSSVLLAPWVVIPSLTSGGATRTVPPAPVLAGIMARNDASGLSPNVPAAGDKGQLRFGIDLSQIPWSDANRDTLQAAGVTVIKKIGGRIEVYDNITLANPSTDPDWLLTSNARLFTAIRAQGNEIAEQFMFSELDGRGHTLAAFKSALNGIVLPYWQDDSLFGATPAEAFNVDLSGNTATSMQAGNLTATLSLRMSSAARYVSLVIAKVAITEAVA
jgi:hypothetical protein